MDIEVLKRAYEREKERRKQAEKLLEEKSRELYLSYEKLNKSHQQLEQTHADLHKQKEELVQLINAYASVTNDLQLAAKLQSDLLPEPLEASTVAASGYFLPALFVAGDAYDFFMLSKDVLALYIIDVEGHGTASAMTSFAIHSQLNPKSDGICKRAMEKHSNPDDAVRATVRHLNEGFYNQASTNKYFTMIYGLLDLTTGVFTWCQAGHPALVLCTDSKTSEIGDGGFPVGTLEDPPYTTESITMQPGERIAVYSDGIIECISDSKEAFGKERLIDLLEQTKTQSRSDCINTLKDTLVDWNGSEEFTDDVTMVIVDYLGAARK